MKTSIFKLTAAICLMLACVRSAIVIAGDRVSSTQLPAGQSGAATANALVEEPSNADLAMLTVIPRDLTLAAENPILAKQVPPPGQLSVVPCTFSVAAVTTTPQTLATQNSATDAPKTLSVGTTSAISATPSAEPSCSESSNGCDDCYKCCKCGPPGNFWLRDEYVGWWAQGGHLPTLVATSPNGTLPATVPLYGNATYNGDYRSGNWTQAGMWFDCCHTHGIQADYFFVGDESSPFTASSDGDPILTRPFIDATTGLPAEELIAVPGIVVGRISIDNRNSLDGAGIDMRCNLCCCCNDCCKSDCGCDSGCGKCWCGENCNRVDFVYGFRYYGFNDNLGIHEQLTSIEPNSPVAIGTQIDVRDNFLTQNNFYGGEIGIIGQHYRGRWMLEDTLKVALGDMNQLVSINGSTIVSFPGQPTAFNQGGIFALSSNIGEHEHNSFVAIPQVSLRIGYRATERLTFMAGYTLMYFSQLARAGDQIDTTINPNLIPPPIGGGPNRPAFKFHPSDLLLQGITLGAEYSF